MAKRQARRKITLISYAAMVRMVKRQHNKVSHDKGCNEDEWQAGYLAACTELLTALAQYKKGTP